MLKFCNSSSKMNWHMLYMLILFLGLCVSIEGKWKRALLEYVGLFGKHSCQENAPLEHSYVTCEETDTNRICTYKCDEGYAFETGDIFVQYTCDYEEGWNEIIELPSCIATCHPMCENDGKCVEGKCVCLPEFRGNICQYPISNCNPEFFTADGIMECKHESNMSTCVFKCPDQTTPEDLPEKSYMCNVTGNWNPPSPPECHPFNAPIGKNYEKMDFNPRDFLRSMHELAYLSTDIIQLKDKSVTSGVCASWGQFSYRTFDGLIYTFFGSCAYVLLEECKSDDFSIHIKNYFDCVNTTNCRRIFVTIDNKEFVIYKEQGEITIKRENEILSIPGRVDNLEFLQANNFLILESSYGFRLRWDGNETILLTVEPFLRNKTCGLCSQFDGIDANDLTASNGDIVRNVITFANSWKKVTSFDQECLTEGLEKHVCQYKTDEERAKFQKSKEICERIFTRPVFSNCKDVVKIDNYKKACRYEYCACETENEKCICSTLAEYLRECVRLGGTVSGDWRNGTSCSLECPEGMIAGQCDKSCPMTCQESYYLCNDQTCVDWCRCPEGKVLDESNGQCVLQEKCNCIYVNEVYAPGSLRMDDCNQCKCVKGSWSCTKNACESRCVVSGNKHYTTFDGHKYDFMGSCSYYLVYHENFYIKQQKVKCNELMDTLVWDNRASCTKSLEIKYKNTIAVIKKFEAYVNKEEINLPYFDDKIKIDKLSHFIKIDIPDDITVFWDRNNRIYIDAMPTLYDQLKGLCGVFNGDYRDDLFSRFGEREGFVNKFAISWKDPTIECREELLEVNNFCETDEKKINLAKLKCSYITSNIFSDCHMFINPEDYETECIQDMCSCIRDDCYCHAIANYAAACARIGKVIPWTKSIPLCDPECYLKQTYSDCTDPCKYSCASSEMKSVVRECVNKCVQGCTCTDGNVLNFNGTCIPFNQCPCLYNGRQYNLYDRIERDGLICECGVEDWVCEEQESNLEYADDTESCDGSENKIRTNESDCQIGLIFCVGETTSNDCKNLTCRCKDGYLLDNITKDCLPKEECARCKHYNVEMKWLDFVIDLNTCEKKVCSTLNRMKRMNESITCFKTCRVWGQNHIQIFDGEIYEPDDIECEKYLIKDGDFKISYKNHYCPKSNIICRVEVTLSLENDTVITQGNELIKKPKSSSHFTIMERGIWLLVFCSNDVILAWDRKSRIYIDIIRLGEMPEGLCLKALSVNNKNLTTTLKVHSDCKSLNNNTKCNDANSKKPTKCKILDTDLFSHCKNVLFNKYEKLKEKCEEDACLCSFDDNCNCSCSAIETIADMCIEAGMTINWRNISFCPLSFDKDCTFNDRTSICPSEETCFKNDIVYKHCPMLPMVEGREWKSCPEEMIRMSVENRTCISRSECENLCVTNKGIFKENETVEFYTNETDACPCICRQNRVECNCRRYCRHGLGDWSYSVDRKNIDLINTNIVPCSLSYINASECVNFSSNSNIQCDSTTAVKCFSHPEENRKFCKDVNIRFSCFCPNVSTSTIPSTKMTTTSITFSTSMSVKPENETTSSPESTSVYSSETTTIMTEKTTSPSLECNDSLGIPNLNINKIYINAKDPKAALTRGRIRLLENETVWNVDIFETISVMVDLENIYNVTGIIYRGTERGGTLSLLLIFIKYSTENPDDLKRYKNKNGKSGGFDVSTEDGNKKYIQFDPSFQARYIKLYLQSPRGIQRIAFQFDLLGCNIPETTTEFSTKTTTEFSTETTTVIPCNDNLNVTIGNTSESEDCKNDYTIKILFNERRMYRIRSVNITITNDETFKIMESKGPKMIWIYSDDQQLNKHKFENDGRSRIFYIYNDKNSKYIYMESFNLCLYASGVKHLDIYEHFTIEVKGCYIAPETSPETSTPASTVSVNVSTSPETSPETSTPASTVSVNVSTSPETSTSASTVSVNVSTSPSTLESSLAPIRYAGNFSSSSSTFSATSSSVVISSSTGFPRYCKKKPLTEEEYDVYYYIDFEIIKQNNVEKKHFAFTWSAENQSEYQHIEVFLNYKSFIVEIDTTKSEVTYYALMYSTDKKEWEKKPDIIYTKSVLILEDYLFVKHLKFFPVAYSGNISMTIKIKTCPQQPCPGFTVTNCMEVCSNSLFCNGSACVEINDCPCEENGIKYKEGETFLKDCATFECKDGKIRPKFPAPSCTIKCIDPNEDPVLNLITCNCTCQCKNMTLECRGDVKKCGLPCDNIKDCDNGEDEDCCISDPPPRGNCSLKKDECEFKPEAEKCSFREKKVIMFSKKVYVCEKLCSGILIKDRSNSTQFSVHFTSDCDHYGESCFHKTFIEHDDLKFRFGEDFKIYLMNGTNSFQIEVSSSNSVIEREKGYEILMVGDTIQFLSTKFGFTVMWRVNNIIDIEVSSCLLDQIVGLCGFYTKVKLNDKRKEDGECITDLCKYFNIGDCLYDRLPNINNSLIDLARKSCKNISELIDHDCKFGMDVNKTVESYNASVVACPESIYRTCSGLKECKCEALKYFFGNRICDNTYQTKYFRKHDCDLCPDGLEWKNCGSDETCDSIKSDNSKKRLVEGCFCPKNLVKINGRCRPAKDCTAKCSVYGDPNYRTFDNKDFRFRSNCSGIYVLVQPKTLEADEPYFQILGVNTRCNKFTNATCTVGVIINYQNNILEVYGNRTVIFNKENVTCNYKNAYCPLGKIPLKELSIKELAELNTFQIDIGKHDIIVTYKLVNSEQHSLRSVTVEVPMTTFHNNTEGLCGVYNDDGFDDFSLQNGVIVEDVNVFVSDWIYGEKKDNCKIFQPEYCPANITECYFKAHENCSLVDTTRFYKRHVESCQADLGCNRITHADLCKYKIMYAEDCCNRHVPIGGWLQHEKCGNITCKENQTYRCVDECETKCPIDRNDQCEKGKRHRMACACPEGYVEKYNKCIKIDECDNCTAKPSLDIPAGHFTIDDCTNQRPILNRRQCIGECNSKSLFEIDGQYKKYCHCCVATATQPVSIPLYCNKNASTVLFSIKEPIECTCRPCRFLEYDTSLYNEISIANNLTFSPK